MCAQSQNVAQLEDLAYKSWRHWSLKLIPGDCVYKHPSGHWPARSGQLMATANRPKDWTVWKQTERQTFDNGVWSWASVLSFSSARCLFFGLFLNNKGREQWQPLPPFHWNALASCTRAHFGAPTSAQLNIHLRRCPFGVEAKAEKYSPAFSMTALSGLDQPVTST